jgi:uncharacterized membrane protein
MTSPAQRAPNPIHPAVLVPLDGSRVAGGAIPTAAPTTDAGGTRPRRPRAIPPLQLHHPVVLEHAARRAAKFQLRIADSITALAGSMQFLYIHAIGFACWMLFVEPAPWPKLTLIVSLEAIFLSTFVMIGQNRQAEFQRAKADHDYATEAQELRTNTELTRAIHTLTTEIHRHVIEPESAPHDDELVGMPASTGRRAPVDL